MKKCWGWGEGGRLLRISKQAHKTNLTYKPTKCV